jgi:DNA invertase Pin-like site-specific DNA recombinase
MSKVYGYARVSTVQQDLEIQKTAIEMAGVTPENIFTDKLSGKNMERENLQKLLSIVEKGDTIIVHKLDRLGRSVSQVMSLVDELQTKGIYLVVINANIDTRRDEGMAGMMTKALMTILSLMAEMEREFILERVQAGVETAKQNGVEFGRPQVNKDLYELAIVDYLENGMTSTQIIKKYGKGSNGKDNITEATLFRRVREYQSYQKAIQSYLESGKTKSIDELIAEGEHKTIKGELKPVLKAKKLTKMLKEIN